MKILLINAGENNFHRIARNYPLGLMYLASYLREQRGGKDFIKILNLRLRNISFETVVKEAVKNKYDLIGISCMTPSRRILHDLVNTIRIQGCLTPVVVRGPHATADPGNILKNKNIDFAVIGEGESTFWQLVDCLEKNQKFTHIPNLALKKNRGIHINPVERIENLDELPFPAWDLVNIDDYLKEYGGSFHLRKRKYSAIILSPFKGTEIYNFAYGFY